MSIKRPILRYHGGKWRIAPWVIEHLPAHKIYVEPFGGAASVLLRKERSYAEVYNDLDGDIVNVFRVFRDQGEELRRRIYATPFSRAEFLGAYETSEDPIERARRTVIRAYMGFSSVGAMRKTGFRSNTHRTHTHPAMDWKNYAEAIPAIVERLRGVVIEHKDAFAVMKDHDSAETLHYVDPPYVLSTRREKEYRFEMDDKAHGELGEFLRGLKGRVIVSGYPSTMYDELFAGWRSVTRAARSDAAGARTEVLWMSYPQEEETAFCDKIRE